MTKAIKTGGEIDSYCTKCKMVLNHRIIAMVGTQPVRVECSTCGSHHNYRPRMPGEKAVKEARAPKSTSTGSSSRSSSPRAPGGARAAAIRAEEERLGRERFWEKAVSGKTPSEFRAYKVTETFTEGELIRHSKFGDGIVTRIVDSKKVEILFREEPKTLAQGLE
jgi:DNA-directed RNA polymerase subunit M/transcription elongation factor TFIIS